MDELQKLMNRIQEWSDITFGRYRIASSMVYHLKKEVDELLEKLMIYNQGEYKSPIHLTIKRKEIYFEFADCFMLILDAASHFGLTADELMDFTSRKLEINKNRKWGEPDENGVVRHIKEEQI
jgi:NTP pyrophosphatase (non-canonical NTP hydrolase)